MRPILRDGHWTPAGTGVSIYGNSPRRLLLAKKKSEIQIPIGERLRTRRVEVLNKGLREMAGLLGVSPAHLTDIEKGNRTPSEELLKRISEKYGVDEAVLRAGWLRADSEIGRIANTSETTAAKVPELLRTARDMTPEQWERLIKSAKKIIGKEPDSKE